MQKSFWHSWFKLVLMLILVLGIWIGVLFLGTHFFGETFERNKIIHYMLLMLMVVKAKDIFLKEIGQDKKDLKEDKQDETIPEKDNLEK
ncbi:MULTISPECIES: hypothetical protein [Fusobacterium]|uniref:hypothetical protein n=1 Tax=Fusobacterium TaxID=848 RepID=UPI001F2C159A|nr:MULTISPECIES: hypothetical protein [Fusobacterium]MCF2613162.1 hypothetical protein [Fusobacterium perfoetens]MDY2981671.1 hypothetical protein [Fusobacterium sp.]